MIGQEASRILLVHGALHGAWCWEKVLDLLTHAGFTAEAFDLPGCGLDPTPPQGVTFGAYVKRTVEVIRSQPGPVLLLGHSMSGGIISRAAEEAADQVAKLVYLTAMLPKDGEALGTIAEFGEDSVVRGVRPSEVSGATTFATELAHQIFYNKCEPSIVRDAVPQLARLAPIEPMSAIINLTPERFGAITKSYIICTADNAIPVRTQRWMCERYPGLLIHDLDADHSPFFSDPIGLSRIIAAEASR